jgi:hypothetical protein
MLLPVLFLHTCTDPLETVNGNPDNELILIWYYF